MMAKRRRTLKVFLPWTISYLLEVKVVNFRPRRSIQTTNDQLLRQCLFQPSHQTVRFYLKLTKGQEISERNRGASNTIRPKVTLVAPNFT